MATSCFRVRVDASPDVGVFPFGVFAIDEDVDRSGRLVRERAGNAFVQQRWSQANELIEPPADGQQEAIQRDCDPAPADDRPPPAEWHRAAPTDRENRPGAIRPC